jgi:hypothetical protein
MMADDPNGRMKAARDVTKMMPEELVAYGVSIASLDTYRQSERRVAATPYKTAMVSAVVGAVVGQCSPGRWDICEGGLWPARP